MELRIGVVHTAKELSVDIDGSVDDLVAEIDAALGGGKPVVWLTDTKGRRVGVATDKLAYLEIDDSGNARHVGFGR
jgi:hypothetical protein